MKRTIGTMPASWLGFVVAFLVKFMITVNWFFLINNNASESSAFWERYFSSTMVLHMLNLAIFSLTKFGLYGVVMLIILWVAREKLEDRRGLSILLYFIGWYLVINIVTVTVGLFTIPSWF